MAIVERHRSPDGLLELLVDYTAGDWTVGFASVTSHSHGDILSELEGGSAESATTAYMKAILASNRIIVVRPIDGIIRDAWIADGPIEDLGKYAGPTETIQKRLWNGATVE